MKKALITGVTGQDGSYLAEFLLSRGYEVHGVKRRSSSFNTARINHIYEGENRHDFHLHYGDLTDSTNIIQIIQRILPDEIYNLAAQSHVQVSFETPEYTCNCDSMGTLRLLEAIKILNLTKKVKFYQASTSELFGKVQGTPQKETTPFYPRSPYGVAKLYSYWITKNYREAYGMFCCNGILFNHESPRRGETFVTRKITRSAVRIKAGLEQELLLGNLDALRDWGFAGDYVRGMWQMLQLPEPDDFILATGRMLSVRGFARLAFKHVDINIEFSGKGIEEVGIDASTGKVLIRVHPRYFRPTEVENLCGDASKARETFGWNPEMNVENLIKMMVDSDMRELNHLTKWGAPRKPSERTNSRPERRLSTS